MIDQVMQRLSRLKLVVPAQAGTHKRNRLPGRASALMDARLRGHDERICGNAPTTGVCR
jgi:hypothetical protein